MIMMHNVPLHTLIMRAETGMTGAAVQGQVTAMVGTEMTRTNKEVWVTMRVTIMKVEAQP